jgi:hypothetical protein
MILTQGDWNGFEARGPKPVVNEGRKEFFQFIMNCLFYSFICDALV